MAIFGPKPWVKCQFFHFLFYSLERRFIALEYRKRNFPGLYLIKKTDQLEKWPFLDQNHWLTPLEKCQFFEDRKSVV